MCLRFGLFKLNLFELDLRRRQQLFRLAGKTHFPLDLHLDRGQSSGELRRATSRSQETFSESGQRWERTSEAEAREEEE